MPIDRGPKTMSSNQRTANSSLAEEKLRARQQWGRDPCGAEYVREHELGTREFFDGIERHRYTEYAPWMPTVMEFGRFTGAKLLEIGCGMGTDLLQFARGGARCIGLDLAPLSIEITRHRFALYGASGVFLVSDGEQLPFASESLDVVYSNGVLHHTPDTVGAISEIHRILRKGGTAKVMLYHRNSLNYWIEIILRRGVLNGDFFRGRSPAEIMSRSVEYSEHQARPLVKVYSRKQARALFSLFEHVNVEIAQLTRVELRLFDKLVSESLFKRLQHRLGWNVIITPKK